MENHMKDLYVSRIRCGYVDIKNDIRVFPATPSIEYDANLLYIKTLNDAEDVLSESEAIQFLTEIGEWSPKLDEEMKIAERHIEHFKTEIFNSYFRSNSKEVIRAHLRTAENYLSELSYKRAALDAYTATGVASFYKNMYIFTKCAKYIDGSPIDWGVEDVVNRMNDYFSSLLNVKEIREIARTSPWTSFWSIYKKSGTSIFKNEYLNMEQLNIIQWSSLYENVNESTECPSDDIINDDDALDGWLILQRKKRESSRNEAALNSIQSKASNHAEQFIIAQDKKDIERVQSLNSYQSLSIMKSRLKQVEQHGILREDQLADVKQNIMMKSG